MTILVTATIFSSQSVALTIVIIRCTVVSTLRLLSRDEQVVWGVMTGWHCCRGTAACSRTLSVPSWAAGGCVTAKSQFSPAAKGTDRVVHLERRTSNWSLFCSLILPFCGEIPILHVCSYDNSRGAVFSFCLWRRPTCTRCIEGVVFIWPKHDRSFDSCGGCFSYITYSEVVICD